MQELGSLQRTFAQAAGVTDVDDLMAKLLHGEKTTRELTSQLVQPTVDGVKKELVRTGRRVVAAVKNGVKDELKDMKEDVAEVKRMLKDMMQSNGDGGKKKVAVRKAKKPWDKTDSPPRSVMKAVRKRSGSNAGLSVAGDVMEKLVEQLYARKEGPAIVAQLMDEDELVVLTKRFKRRGSSEDDAGLMDADEDEDEEMDEDEDEEYDEEEYDEEMMENKSSTPH